MRSLKVTRLVFALAFGWAAAGHGTDSRADPLLTQGVGIANCGKLANDLKPSLGLDHPPGPGGSLAIMTSGGCGYAEG